MGTENKIFGKIVKTEEQIVERIIEIGNELNLIYDDEDDVLIISVSKGGNNFTYDLIKKIKFDIKMEFISSDSYYKKEKVSKPKINFSPNVDIKNKRIIIIDDYIDSGETMIEITNKIRESKPKDILVLGLFGNPKRQKSINTIEMFGWEEEIRGFLVGYGLDYDEKYRNIPYVAIIKGTEY